MAGRDYLINTRRPRLLRSHISRSENVSVALIFFALIGLVAWVISTHDNFDADERDLPIELLQGSSRDIPIYTRPLKLWSEPGQQAGGSVFDPGPFPEQVIDSEWQPVGRVKRFQTDNLYEKINGEAEKFVKQGFVELAYLVLRAQSDGTEIAIELFDQGDLGGSLGIFAEHAAGREVAVHNGVSYFTTGAGVIGRKDNYFFRVAGDRQSEAVIDKASSLVSAFSALGERPSETTAANELPEGFVLLRDRLGIDESGIQYQESNVFQYDFAERFWFGELGSGDARVFVHFAADPDEARRLLDALLEEQLYEYDREADSDRAIVLRHRYLGTWFVMTRDGRFVYGAENLADLESAVPWLERLGENLSDDEA